MKWANQVQFRWFRIVFGIYLTIHFLTFLPHYAIEMFSREGIFPKASALPSYINGIFLDMDEPWRVQLLLYTMIVCSVLFTLGQLRRCASLILYLGWTWFLNRNPFITNPSIAYVGWLLLACVVIPTDEGQQKKTDGRRRRRWEIPDALYFGAWLVMAIGYSASGFDKIFNSPSWIDGTALKHVLTGPLAREWVQIVLEQWWMPPVWCWQGLTWISLFAETSFLFLGTFYHCRKWYWLFFFLFHCGILATINFTDLTCGMLMIHLFTFDSSWFAWSRKWTMVEKEVEEEEAHTPEEKEDNSSGRSRIPDVETVLTWSWKVIETGFWFLLGFTVVKYDLLEWSYMTNMIEITDRFSMGFGCIASILGLMMAAEQIWPDQTLPRVQGWWKWVIGINVFQLFTVVLATFTWETWLQNTDYFRNQESFHFRDHFNPFWGGFVAYVINQWLFYWWHRARHDVYCLWISCHQFHHSATRLEAITSFYKHPLEMMLDSFIMAVLNYSVLGNSPESSIWLSFFSACGEYFYHMNIRTPRWIGFIFQRPESHRYHHLRDKREQCTNFGDLVWCDMLGGTYYNPERADIPCGFSKDKELQRTDMLLFKDVLVPRASRRSRRHLLWIYLLVIWGSLNSILFFTHQSAQFRAIGFTSASTPLPLVFTSFKGTETFVTRFQLDIQFQEKILPLRLELDRALYAKIQGPYNRRNIYGAMFSHGPMFDDTKMIALRDQVLFYAVCSEERPLVKEFGFDEENVHVHTLLVAVSNNKTMFVKCPSFHY